jgi:hypothetical protein
MRLGSSGLIRARTGRCGEFWQNAGRIATAPSRAPIHDLNGLDPPADDVLAMAVVQYESKENAGHRFWTARYGRCAIRIETNRPGTYRWLITYKGGTVRNGVAPTVRRQLPR